MLRSRLLGAAGAPRSERGLLGSRAVTPSCFRSLRAVAASALRGRVRQGAPAAARSTAAPVAATLDGPRPPSAASTTCLAASRALQGFDNIQHLIFIVQENRSFDHYFGTFPGADGIPTNAKGQFTVCVPDPVPGACAHARTTTRPCSNQGGPHSQPHRAIDVNGGRMDGFIQAVGSIGRTRAARPDESAGLRWHATPARSDSPT